MGIEAVAVGFDDDDGGVMISHEDLLTSPLPVRGWSISQPLPDPGEVLSGRLEEVHPPQYTESRADIHEGCERQVHQLQHLAVDTMRSRLDLHRWCQLPPRERTGELDHSTGQMSPGHPCTVSVQTAVTAGDCQPPTSTPIRHDSSIRARVAHDPVKYLELIIPEHSVAIRPKRAATPHKRGEFLVHLLLFYYLLAG